MLIPVVRGSGVTLAAAQFNAKHAARAFAAGDGDAPTRGLNDFLGDGEAQPAAAGIRAARLVDPVERLENAVVQRFGNAHALVLNFDGDRIFIMADANFDGGRVRAENDGIVKQVLDGQFEFRRVGPDVGRGGVRMYANLLMLSFG